MIKASTLNFTAEDCEVLSLQSWLIFERHFDVKADMTTCDIDQLEQDERLAKLSKEVIAADKDVTSIRVRFVNRMLEEIGTMRHLVPRRDLPNSESPMSRFRLFFECN